MGRGSTCGSGFVWELSMSTFSASYNGLKTVRWLGWKKKGEKKAGVSTNVLPVRI